MPLSVTAYTFALALPEAATAHLPAVRCASFGIGDTMFLVVIALIVFGPKKLPEISRQIGKLVFEFRKASNDFKFQIEEELRASEQAERQKQMQAQAAAPQPATPVALTAEQTVSAQPAELSAPVQGETVQSETVLTPSIQPPATGLPVSSNRPYGSAPVTDAAPESNQAGSAEEMQANSREAVAAAEPLSEPEPPIQTQTETGDAIPTHHG